jgi:RimJ/RimL family protein N-acetyltransferase
MTKNGVRVIIRDAEPKDAQSLIDVNMNIVNEKIYMMREPGEAIYTVEGEKNKIERYLNSEGSLYLSAEVNNKVIGYIDFQNGGLKRTKHAGSFSIYILKNWRQAGIGSMLLGSLIEWAERNPLIEKITLAVFSTNENAQVLYRKFGFTEEGRCPKDMKLKDGTYMDSVLMYKFVK